jgi:hypothetical protein
LPGVSFDEADGLKLGGSEAGTAPGVESAASSDSWKTVLTGPVAFCNTNKGRDLTLNDSTVLANTEKWHVTLAAPSAGTTSSPSLMLDGTEGLTLNFAKASMEYKEQWESAGDVTSLKYDDTIFLNFGAATARQQASFSGTGGVAIFKYDDDITLSPNDPTDLARDRQHIECANGDHFSLTLDDTVRLKVGGLALRSRNRLTETGDVISIELDSLLSKPGPDG